MILSLFTNYRPISLLHAISNIFENVIFLQIYNFFKKKQLLYCAQYGFRTEHSTECASLELVDKIILNMDKRKHQLEFFLIYQKHLTPLIMKYCYTN